MKTLEEQLGAARRELALRRSAYPKWVRDGRMTQARADHETQCMEAIVATLEKLRHLEEASEQMRGGAGTNHVHD